MDAVANIFYERIVVILLAASFGILASRIAWKKGYYVLPPETETLKGPTGVYVFGAFVIFLFLEIFAGTIFQALWTYWNPSSDSPPPEMLGWANLGVYVLIAAALVGYFCLLEKPVREAIWGSPSEIRSLKRNFNDYLVGCLTWILAFPWVVVITQLLAVIFSFFYTEPLPEQAAVQQLKDIFNHPWLFGATAVAVSTIVPFTEELLFRGFMQSWLKTTFSRNKAILLTALIFACFHFTMSQGIENLEFISALFLLSCYLGFVKERQQSLWASIGLHSTFNLISVLMLLFQE